jgi:elongation factor P
MDLVNFEQLEISRANVGRADKFLQPGMQLPVEFFEGKAISVVLPEIVEAKVTKTTPPVHAQQESAWKEATLDNGLQIRVPMFIGPGEIVRVEVTTCRYLERAHSERKQTA